MNRWETLEVYPDRGLPPPNELASAFLEDVLARSQMAAEESDRAKQAVLRGPGDPGTKKRPPAMSGGFEPTER